MAPASTELLVQLVFDGECTEGRDPLTVRRAIAVALKLDEKRASFLFSGKPVVLKRQVDLSRAARHIARFAVMGAVLRAQPVPAAPQSFDGPTADATPSAEPALSAKTPLAGAVILGLASRWPQRRLAIRILGLVGLSTVLVATYLMGKRLGEHSAEASKTVPARLAAATSAAAPAKTPLTTPLTTPASFETPLGSAAVVPAGVNEQDELARLLSPQAAVEYKHLYLPAKWHKAFALSESGAHAWVVNADSDRQAREAALAQCMQALRSAQSGCRLVDVNGQTLE